MWSEETLLAIIADDLTGSCDTACQFARFGLASFVTHLPLAERARCLSKILVVNSDSRKLKAAGAQRTIFQVCQDLQATRRVPFYKKIDSTLKGNWAGEVATIVKSCGPDLVLVAPAFPEWGRTTVDGIQKLDGVPVSETKLARRSLGRSARTVPSADIPATLQTYFGKKVFLINAPNIRKGPGRIEHEIVLARSRGFRFIVFDVVRDEDLLSVCLGGCRFEQTLLWVGSAGLARFLPLGWGYSPIESRLDVLPAKTPCLLVIGSLHPANRQQLAMLTQSRKICRVTLEDDDTLNNQALHAKLSLALESLRQGIDIALSLHTKRVIHSLSQLQRLHAALQWLAGGLISSGLLGGLVLVGGETATKIYNEVGAAGINVMGEIQPGVPVGFWVGGGLNGCPVITKAGGFGREDTLLRAMEFIRGGPRAA